mgnify:CR=1 FL=1
MLAGIAAIMSSIGTIGIGALMGLVVADVVGRNFLDAPITGVSEIAARAVEGGRVFDIRMDPAELGRVEVRLELGSDNSVRALLSAERAETLAELQRSARDLERALAEAGLDLAEDGLSFSMSGQGDQAGEENAPGFAMTADPAEHGPAAAEPASGGVRFYGFELAARSRGLDVRI